MTDLDEIIDDVNNYEERFKGYWDFSNKYDKAFPAILADQRTEDSKKAQELLITCLRNGRTEPLEKIAKMILDQQKLIDWESQSEFIDKCFDTIREAALLTDVKRHYTSVVEKLLKLLKNYQIFDRHAATIFRITETSLSRFDDPDLSVHNAALCCITMFNWNDHIDKIQTAVKLLLKLVKHNPDLSEGAWQCTSAGMVITISMREVSGTSVHELLLDDISEIFNHCASCKWQNSKDATKNTIAYVMCKSILEDFLRGGSTTPHLVKPMIKSIKKLYECEDEVLQKDAGFIMTAMAGEPELTGDYTQHFLTKFLDGKLPMLITRLVKMYQHHSDQFTSLLPQFNKFLQKDSGMNEKMTTVQLFCEIAKKEPQLIKSDVIDAIADLLHNERLKNLAMLFFSNMSSLRPGDVQRFEETFISIMHAETTISVQAAGVLVHMAHHEDREIKYLSEIATACRKTKNDVTKLCLIGNMRTIGLKSPSLLVEYKKMFIKYAETPSLSDICQSTIYLIEGRTLEEVSQNVEQQGNEMKILDNCVTVTEEKVESIGEKVKVNTEDTKQVKEMVAHHEERLVELKETVEETVDKVDELNHKTLSHAPVWSREVAEMLNPVSEHDWRLLASRLGYSDEDLLNWATQPDPCLSLFDEWFATHKTREATYGILKTLVEMDRTDASSIVEKALEQVAHLVDEDDEEPSVPPAIFLSYQWAHQAKVKLLRRHLNAAGYSCWMDIGQMGGGDKLFAKIDAGIRGAKVIVCCVTSKYAESTNCHREVNLAVTLGKPIIPLQMENLAWPPPGSMGPIFSEYIFIRFFRRPNEKPSEGDERFWAEPKFIELLMQMRYTVAPDSSLITQDTLYKNWWEPPEEILVIKPHSDAVTSTIKDDANQDGQAARSSPVVFISYQWAIQSQVKDLYSRLTGLGYTCWLDVMQMGGGDSLYEKIDSGVRGCKVVVCCVTSKYALSNNCRREVSLADSIKKPIIPLKFDSDMKWPPEGRMSMVFASQVFIEIPLNPAGGKNISCWDSPQFDKLVNRINLYLKPGVRETSALDLTPVTVATSTGEQAPASKEHPISLVNTPVPLQSTSSSESNKTANEAENTTTESVTLEPAPSPSLQSTLAPAVAAPSQQAPASKENPVSLESQPTSKTRPSSARDVQDEEPLCVKEKVYVTEQNAIIKPSSPSVRQTSTSCILI